jgi:NAD-dependent DNA ligase
LDYFYLTRCITSVGCSAETGTKKCQDAEAKGIAIVDEAWVRARLPGGGGSVASASASKAVRASASNNRKQAILEDDVEEKRGNDSGSAAESGGVALKGFVFAITGTLSVPRAQFEKLITDNGGQVAKSVTNACTHLVSAETGTKKCQDAEEKGCAIVDEDWVRSKILKGSTVIVRSNAIPPESFVPLFDFIEDLMDFEEDEGSVDFNKGKR